MISPLVVRTEPGHLCTLVFSDRISQEVCTVPNDITLECLTVGRDEYFMDGAC